MSWQDTPCIVSRSQVRKWYERHYGVLPKHIYVLHYCDTPFCKNISHIWLGTQWENMNDAAKKKRLIGRTGQPLSEELKRKISQSVAKTLERRMV